MGKFGYDGETLWGLADDVKNAGKKATVLEVLSEYSLHTAAKAGIAERVRALIEGGGCVGMPLTPS